MAWNGWIYETKLLTIIPVPPNIYDIRLVLSFPSLPHAQNLYGGGCVWGAREESCTYGKALEAFSDITCNKNLLERCLHFRT